jgi:hypothetical protein
MRVKSFTGLDEEPDFRASFVEECDALGELIADGVVGLAVVREQSYSHGVPP